MSFKGFAIDDLVRIAHAGGGMKIDCRGRTTDDLVRIAHAAKNKGKLSFTGMAGRTTDELVRIAHAGGGSILFDTE